MTVAQIHIWFPSHILLVYALINPGASLLFGLPKNRQSASDPGSW
jgi:hypothetical protein